MVVARRVEGANVSDRRVGARLLGGLQSGFPSIRTVMADAGYESGKLACELKRRHGWRLHITKRRQRAFKVVGLTWIVERTFAWLARNRRLSKDYELKVQTSEAFIDLAAIPLMLKSNGSPRGKTSQTPSYREWNIVGQYDVPGFFYLESRFRLNPGEVPASYTAFELCLHESQFERVQV